MSRRWQLNLTATTVRNLERLPEKAAAAVVESFATILEQPHRVGRPLRLDLEGRFAARRGPYRIIYRVDDDERIVTIEAIGHRADVYRRR